MSMSRRGFAVVAVAVAVAMAVTMFAVAGCGSDDASAVPTVTLVQGATDLSVDVAVGDEFVVEVASNPTTGYSWAYRGVGSGADVAEVSSTFTGADTEAVGSGGTQVWRFRAESAGAGRLVFSETPPGAASEPTGVVEVALDITGGGAEE
jgi:predicted secreted protein